MLRWRRMHRCLFSARSFYDYTHFSFVKRRLYLQHGWEELKHLRYEGMVGEHL